MKHTQLISTILLTSLLSVSIGGCAGCKGCNATPIDNDITPTIEVTVPATPTKEVMPTEIAEIPTLIPSPTPKPMPTMTPIPTVTPLPTSTPTPVITVDENATLLGSAKMGDNVWYDFYDDGTLMVRGTGATYDFKDYNDMQLTIRKQTDFLKDESLYNVVKVIIIKEGITEIGTSSLDTMGLAEKVVFPTSLKKIGDMALSGVGYFTNIEWIGLDVDKVEISKTAFSYCGNAHKVTGLSKYTATPTPTPIPPTPTPTPLPNPDKPRKVATLVISDTITYEFWDNDVMYVKGSGAIPDQSELFNLDSEIFNPTGYTFAEKIKTVVVDEGITSFGKLCFCGLWNANEWYLPKSLTSAPNVSQCGGNIFHMYFEGNEVTVKFPSTSCILYNECICALEDEAYALEKEATIIWE